MNIVVSNRSDQPIYEQIKEQVKFAIIRGELCEGDMLPSIRLLAQDLRVSVITTKRAYDELEAEGFVASMQGRGCFVLPQNKELIREQKLCEIEQHLADAIIAARMADLADEEVLKMLEIILKEVK